MRTKYYFSVSFYYKHGCLKKSKCQGIGSKLKYLFMTACMLTLLINKCTGKFIDSEDVFAFKLRILFMTLMNSLEFNLKFIKKSQNISRYEIQNLSLNFTPVYCCVGCDNCQSRREIPIWPP